MRPGRCLVLPWGRMQTCTDSAPTNTLLKVSATTGLGQPCCQSTTSWLLSWRSLHENNDPTSLQTCRKYHGPQCMDGVQTYQADNITDPRWLCSDWQREHQEGKGIEDNNQAENRGRKGFIYLFLITTFLYFSHEGSMKSHGYESSHPQITI